MDFPILKYTAFVAPMEYPYAPVMPWAPSLREVVFTNATCVARIGAFVSPAPLQYCLRVLARVCKRRKVGPETTMTLELLRAWSPVGGGLATAASFLQADKRGVAPWIEVMRKRKSAGLALPQLQVGVPVAPTFLWVLIQTPDNQRLCVRLCMRKRVLEDVVTFSTFRGKAAPLHGAIAVDEPFELRQSRSSSGNTRFILVLSGGRVQCVVVEMAVDVMQ